MDRSRSCVARPVAPLFVLLELPSNVGDRLRNTLHSSVTSQSMGRAAASMSAKRRKVLLLAWSSTSSHWVRHPTHNQYLSACGFSFRGPFDRISNSGCLVYPLRIDGSELTSIEDGIDRLREICGDTRFEHITARAQLKSRVHKIDVLMHR